MKSNMVADLALYETAVHGYKFNFAPASKSPSLYLTEPCLGCSPSELDPKLRERKQPTCFNDVPALFCAQSQVPTASSSAILLEH
jgi:hypothetical protein